MMKLKPKTGAPMQPKILAPFVRNPYNYDTMQASDESGLKCPEPTLTQQQFKDESDINFIADRYGLTGEMPQVQQPPAYADYEGVFDFQSAQNAVIAAREQFMTLPAKLRTRFDNDPQKLLSFVADPENRAEAEFLGIIPKPQTEATHETRSEEIPRRTTQEKARPAGAPGGQSGGPSAEAARPEAAQGDR